MSCKCIRCVTSMTFPGVIDPLSLLEQMLFLPMPKSNKSSSLITWSSESTLSLSGFSATPLLPSWQKITLLFLMQEKQKRSMMAPSDSWKCLLYIWPLWLSTEFSLDSFISSNSKHSPIAFKGTKHENSTSMTRLKDFAKRPLIGMNRSLKMRMPPIWISCRTIRKTRTILKCHNRMTIS